MLSGTISANCQATTIIEDKWLQNAIKWIEQGKVDAQLVTVLTQKNDSLLKRIDILENMVRLHKEKDTAQVQVTGTYENELKNTREQLTVATAAMKKINKLLKRQKRKTVFVGIGTAAVAVGAYFLFLK